MRKTVSKAICIANIILWSFLSWGHIIILAIFAKRFIQDMANGKFVPGMLFLIAFAVFSLVLATRRVIKQVKSYKNL